jgi:hypothetical protein
MVATLVTILLAVGTVIGWYTHRAWLRIDAWGGKMNDCDAIFRLTSEEGEYELQRVGVLAFDERSAAQPLGSRRVL